LITVNQRFYKYVSKGLDCWNWVGDKLKSNGKWSYGRFWLNGKTVYAHRVSWILNKGDIPNNICVCHKCDNPLCVNPDHLFLGTYSDNIKDAVDKKRMAYGIKSPNSKLTDGMVINIREMYKNENYTQKQLADEFGVDRTTIARVVNRETWNHV